MKYQICTDIQSVYHKVSNMYRYSLYIIKYQICTDIQSVYHKVSNMYRYSLYIIKYQICTDTQSVYHKVSNMYRYSLYIIKYQICTDIQSVYLYVFDNLWFVSNFYYFPVSGQAWLLLSSTHSHKFDPRMTSRRWCHHLHVYKERVRGAVTSQANSR